jgi:2-methylisocitrate lyase-like PEP mutase family enzyme
MIQHVGIKAVYMTGYGTSAANFGSPDLGLLTMTEMVENASRIADSVAIPVIADADTGYGNPLNVSRAVKMYEKAGVAAIHIEDQLWPKRCGHMSGKKTIPLEDMVEKLKAAVDSRQDKDFLIIARTDAIATEGFNAAINRARMYSDAGADVLFVEAPTSIEQVKAIPKLIPEKPHLINMAPLTPNLPAKELEELGFSLAIYPGICLAATISSCLQVLEKLNNTGSQGNLEEWINSFADLNNFLGLSGYLEMQDKYKS